MSKKLGRGLASELIQRFVLSSSEASSSHRGPFGFSGTSQVRPTLRVWLFHTLRLFVIVAAVIVVVVVVLVQMLFFYMVKLYGATRSQ